MSANYANGLSDYDNKGVCGLQEIFESPEEVESKVQLLAKWLAQSKSCVVYCGAGISTSAGIPDFRGPNGIWTQEKKGVKPDAETNDRSLAKCFPTQTHMALISLIKAKSIRFIISQNIDGLFLRTNIRRRQIAELHGNFFLDECTHCNSRFIRSTPSHTMALKVSDRQCLRSSRPCRGYLRDTILDWEDELPKNELKWADKYSRESDLSICLGTTLQIEPVGSMPFLSKKLNSGRVVIINLQPTKFDTKADLVIHDYVDNVMILLCKQLNIQIDSYDPTVDPIINKPEGTEWRR
ncbi:NAD-dependent protein deacylase sirtuin-6-like [Oppia nitens]|uniref:NAD-dependent protein deacylase sirtuin-6-like n=1 Tax=Oppia nitens TaxID=1686743 RepID=UPI0023DBB6F6|nr:NAD-dependent protein deacylase sirtuin-6-like [Oppia nitens]